jgi:5-methylcytosine-specific restriction endonuclease McrA
MPTSPKTFRSIERRKEREQFRGSKQSRGYGGEWERISLLKRQANAVCEMCKAAPADDVDHIVPFDGVDDPKRTEWQNLQSICRACHNCKTHQRNGKMG